ncbi:MAG: TraR/DksA C4-type zinc finger protein [Salinisphaeraceae bacterium]
MTRAIDIAAERTQAMTDQIVANRVRYEGTSAHECQDCGDPIPEERRRSIAGTQHCTDCADYLQRRGLL